MSAATEEAPKRALFDLRPREWPFALPMCGYFFLVITTFWILKPVKKGLFIEYYDDRAFHLGALSFTAAQAEIIAKVLNMVVAFAGVVAFTFLSRRLTRERLTYAFSGFFGVCFVLYAALLADPGWFTVWSFYLFGDLYSTLMVATFFAFLNDSVPKEASRRLYGVVVAGGVAGGVVGSMVVSRLSRDLPVESWLWLCLGVGAAIVFLARISGNRVKSAFPEAHAADAEPTGVAPSGSAALEGARLVLRSRYLLSIVAIVGIYEIVSTIMDFQFTSTVAHYLDGRAIRQQFSTVFAITNAVSMFIQIFVTGFLMNRFPLGVSLATLPSAMLLGSTAFLLAPVLWVGSLLNTVDNALAYSLNQSAKEALYTVTSRDEKYKAKAFIDMFVQRFAKAIAVGVSLIVTSVFADFGTIRWLSLVTIVLVVGWFSAARYAAKRFEEAG
jgi:AAA family ATP:ADP antiporter